MVSSLNGMLYIDYSPPYFVWMMKWAHKLPDPLKVVPQNLLNLASERQCYANVVMLDTNCLSDVDLEHLWSILAQTPQVLQADDGLDVIFDSGTMVPMSPFKEDFITMWSPSTHM